MVLCFDMALNPNHTSMALCLAPNELHHMPFLTVTFSLKFLIKNKAKYICYKVFANEYVFLYFTSLVEKFKSRPHVLI